MDQTLDGGIFENVNPLNGEGHTYLAQADAVFTRTMRNTLSLRGPSGVTAGSALMGNGVTNAAIAIMEHNGWFGSAFNAWGGFICHPGNTPATNQEYLYYRSNNHYATSGSSNFPLMALTESDGCSVWVPNNTVNVAGIKNNNIFGGSTAARFGAGVDSNCNPSTALGSHYDICTTATWNVVDLTQDPKSLDNTRNAAQWAYRLHGQAASSAGVLQAMMNCQDAWYCYQELWTWVRQGAQPTNLALKGAAHDGKIVGVAGAFGSGYSGSCGVTFSPRDPADLGAGATATCSFAGGVPSVTITSGGNYYRVATPATVGITCGGCTPTVPASLAAVVSPSDIGPVQITAFGRVE